MTHRATLIASMALAGCAMSPQYMAQQSNWDVCRFTMGGPHSVVAQQESARRGLDCRPYYGPITAQGQAQNAATQSFIQSTQPPQPLRCTSTAMGGGVTNTTCR